MAQTKDLRNRSTTPDTPDAGVTRYWANSSGILRFTNSAGTSFDANSFFPTVSSYTTITTGAGVFGGATAALSVTGIAFGSTGAFTKTAYLGAPAGWIAVTGPSGESWALPAFTRS
jgi:hypothetical protein